MLNEFIRDVCDILDIPVPELSYDTSVFTSDTMQALVTITSDRTVMHLKTDKPDLDLLFAVAHELRHIWQLTYDEELYFSSYKPRESCSSVEEYNLQPAEIDAHAFAGIIIEDFFGAKPLFKNLSDTVRLKVFDRMESLSSLYFG